MDLLGKPALSLLVVRKGLPGLIQKPCHGGLVTWETLALAFGANRHEVLCVLRNPFFKLGFAAGFCPFTLAWVRDPVQCGAKHAEEVPVSA